MRTSNLIPAVLALALATPALAGPKANLAGAEGETKVLIRSVDDGQILWVGGYKLGTKASVDPGSHKISVMCEIHSGPMTVLMPGETKGDFEAGKTYDLTGSIEAGAKACAVEVKARR